MCYIEISLESFSFFHRKLYFKCFYLIKVSLMKSKVYCFSFNYPVIFRLESGLNWFYSHSMGILQPPCGDFRFLIWINLFYNLGRIHPSTAEKRFLSLQRLVSTKRSYILEQNCSSQLQVCLGMYVSILVDIRHLKGYNLWNMDETLLNPNHQITTTSHFYCCA